MSEIEYFIFLDESDIDCGRLNTIFNEFSRCFLLYKGEFGQNPDTIEFSGEYGKRLMELMKAPLSSMFTVCYSERHNECVVMKSKKNPVKTMKTGGPVCVKTDSPMSNSSRSDGLVPYSGESVNSYLQSYMGGYSHTVERDVDTEITFSINVMKK